MECTRRVGYGGLYAEMIYNSRLQNGAAGFYETEYNGLKGLGQSQQWLRLQPGREYAWNVVAGQTVIVRVMPEFRRYVLFEGTGSKGSFSIRFNCPEGGYELLRADGVDLKITAGTGKLRKLPPLSVAFIQVNK